MTMAEIYKELEKYEDSDGVKAKYIRSMLDGSYDKPQLGVKPYWIVIPERIAELADAIKRLSATGDRDEIYKLSVEINVWAQMMQMLKKKIELEGSCLTEE